MAQRKLDALNWCLFRSSLICVEHGHLSRWRGWKCIQFSWYISEVTPEMMYSTVYFTKCAAWIKASSKNSILFRCFVHWGKKAPGRASCWPVPQQDHCDCLEVQQLRVPCKQIKKTWEYILKIIQCTSVNIKRQDACHCASYAQQPHHCRELTAAVTSDFNFKIKYYSLLDTLIP